MLDVFDLFGLFKEISVSDILCYVAARRMQLVHREANEEPSVMSEYGTCANKFSVGQKGKV